jgi:hypothetical protein
MPRIIHSIPPCASLRWESCRYEPAPGSGMCWTPIAARDLRATPMGSTSDGHPLHSIGHPHRGNLWRRRFSLLRTPFAQSPRRSQHASAFSGMSRIGIARLSTLICQILTATHRSQLTSRHLEEIAKFSPHCTIPLMIRPFPSVLVTSYERKNALEGPLYHQLETRRGIFHKRRG